MNEFVLSTEILTQFEFENSKTYNVRAIILLKSNNRFKEAYNLNILGKPMKEWVRSSVKNFENRFVQLEDSDDPLEVIKPFIRDEDYTIVLFSDTPTITENVVLEVLDYATTKGLDFCKLPRGFIVKSQNYKIGKIEFSAEPSFVNKDDFLVFFDAKTLSLCENILKNRIIDRHLRNKVIIHDPNSTYIDDQVEIGSRCEIYPNNSLRGQTIIEDNVTLFENNVIINSTICANNDVKCSYIENEVIKPLSNLKPFSVVIKENNSKEDI